MMKLIAIVAFVASCLVICALADSEEKYSDKYDHIDVSDILKNDRLRAQYVQCITDSGPCRTPDAVFLREHFPEAIVTRCRKCTERQKNMFNLVVVWFTENDPKGWENIMTTAVAQFTAKGDLRRKMEKMEKAEKSQ